jgi:hypothetical protein
MAALRKRKWLPPRKDVKPLDYVWPIMFAALPWFKTSQVGKTERTEKSRTASGRYAPSRKHIADWELDVWKSYEEPTDCIVKINLWSAKGKNIGESYRVSMARARNVAQKLAGFVQGYISRMREGEL